MRRANKISEPSQILNPSIMLQDGCSCFGKKCQRQQPPTLLENAESPMCPDGREQCCMKKTDAELSKSKSNKNVGLFRLKAFQESLIHGTPWVSDLSILYVYPKEYVIKIMSKYIYKSSFNLFNFKILMIRKHCLIFIYGIVSLLSGL